LSGENEFDGLRVVLVNTRNPLNIGAAARAMSNFGFLRLRVVNPFELAFREARSAVGAGPMLAQAEEFQSLTEAVGDCALIVGTTALSRRHPEQLVRNLQEGARMIRKRLAVSRVALLFGSEKRGLSNEDLSHCHWLLHIPTREAHRSMNLGQAVAVCLYELARAAKTNAPAKKLRLAPAGDLERLTSLLLDALNASGYLRNRQPDNTKLRSAAPAEEKIRRFVRRMNLSSADAELLLGMLRQILWKLDQTDKASRRE
jgi:TrmH family RNA methyltransferase